MAMDRRMKEALDRHITGNYGEDQFKHEARLKTCGWCKFFRAYKSGGHTFPRGYWIGDGICTVEKQTKVVGDSCDDWETKEGRR